jgi:hypothetical protein
VTVFTFLVLESQAGISTESAKIETEADTFAWADRWGPEDKQPEIAFMEAAAIFVQTKAFAEAVIFFYSSSADLFEGLIRRCRHRETNVSR